MTPTEKQKLAEDYAHIQHALDDHAIERRKHFLAGFDACEKLMSERSNAVFMEDPKWINPKWKDQARIEVLLSCLEEARDTLMSLRNLVDNDHVVTKTEDDEKTYWVSNDDLQTACDETLESIEAKMKELK